MDAYIVRFNHSDDGVDQPEGMFLCLHATSLQNASEKFWQLTGGEGSGNFIVSVSGKDCVEQYWDRRTGKFFTIPLD